MKFSISSKLSQIFDRYQYVLHYSVLGKALETIDAIEAKRLGLKIKIAMLRYIDLLQPDKLLYDAGMACREFGDEYENMAFVFLNQYLDIVDSIEENDPSLVDNSIFEGTDVPTQYALPQQMFLNVNLALKYTKYLTIQPEEHEEVKEYVLAISVDQKTRKDLKCDERGCFEASSIDLLGNTYPICIITGQSLFKN